MELLETTVQTAIERVDVNTYTVPTDSPESDGTLEWNATTIVVVHVHAGGEWGMGYSYTAPSAAQVIQNHLVDRVVGQKAMDVPACWVSMTQVVRNLGDAGLTMMAVSAVDSALWDLKARMLGVPLVSLLGAARPKVPIYGSGGFTSYSIDRLQEQLGGWASRGIKRVKMKVGRDAKADADRVRAAREAIGPDVELFVDANGGYDRKQALAMAEVFNCYHVTWFEEPVYHRDLEGLRLLRDRAPAGMDIAIGEYGFEARYFLDCLNAQAVDVLQADATRCGITGFLQADALCRSYFVPLSSHCAPALHMHPCCAAERVRHMEYFYDHVRIEHLLFDGVVDPMDGCLTPDLTRPGMGLELKRKEARRYEI